MAHICSDTSSRKEQIKDNKKWLVTQRRHKHHIKRYDLFIKVVSKKILFHLHNHQNSFITPKDVVFSNSN